MTIKLPDLVPFNDPVTVCAECGKASCLQSALPLIRCAAHKAGPVLTKQVPLADLQSDPREHFGYWKGAPGRDPDMPPDLVALRVLIRFQRNRNGAEDRGMLIGYLEYELGIDPEQVAEAMAAEWPEAQS